MPTLPHNLIDALPAHQPGGIAGKRRKML
jgi:hypothetical protein